MGARYDVFISHSTSAADWSRDFARRLQDQGLNVFYDEWSVAPGSKVEDSIRRGIQDSDSVVVVLDPSSSSSTWTAFEMGAALGLGKRVVSVVDAAVVGALPSPVRNAPYVVMTSPEESAKQVANILTTPST